MEDEPDSPCARWHHEHPPVRDINAEFDGAATVGQRFADRVATAVGSWPFILVQTAILALWVLANVWLLVHPTALKAWDPYPFIFLNLVFSLEAAYTGPVVLMSQNRQSEKDRLTARRDVAVNTRAELEIAVIMEHLVHQDQQIAALRTELGALTALLQSRA